ncbi:hypothetical protein HYT05_00580 [Candidatus Kaiserbacteria bacterium]|nr:hypothetical protein [Candidatus Kaiserbacteria bacterium]
MRKSFRLVCALLFVAVALLAIATAVIAGASMCASAWLGDWVLASSSLVVFFIAILVTVISAHFARKFDDDTNPPLL